MYEHPTQPYWLQHPRIALLAFFADPGEPEKSQGSSSSSSRSSSSNSSSTRGLEDQQPLVYACSWWNAAQAGQYLQDRSLPIWNSLSQGHVELYREVRVCVSLCVFVSVRLNNHV
jgi:hypothetical protein